MNILFKTSLLLLASITLSGANEWLFYKNYPWVYDYKSKDWLFLKAGNDGKIYAYRNSTKEWGEFSELLEYATEDDIWNDNYEEWLKNPEKYGGLEVLERIKEAKENNATELLIITETPILDISPLSGLNNLSKVTIGGTIHEFSDLTPLANLTNLSELLITGSNITQLAPLTNLSNLTKLGIEYCNSLTDISPIAEITGLKMLILRSTSVSDISALSGLINLTEIYMPDMTVSDITPLINLVNLKILTLNFTGSQKSTLEAALPNLTLYDLENE